MCVCVCMCVFVCVWGEVIKNEISKFLIQIEKKLNPSLLLHTFILKVGFFIKNHGKKGSCIKQNKLVKYEKMECFSRLKSTIFSYEN